RSISLFSSSAPHRHLHSFPTRRSSELARHLESFQRHAVQLARQIEQCGVAFAGDPLEDGPRRLAHRLVARGRSVEERLAGREREDRKSTRLNSSHVSISYAVFCLKKKT